MAVVWIQLVYLPRWWSGRVLGDVDRGAAVLAAEGETLGEPQGHAG